MPRKNLYLPVEDPDEAHLDEVMRELHERPHDPLTHAQIGYIFKKSDGKPRSRQRVAVRIRRTGGSLGPVQVAPDDSRAIGIIWDPSITSLAKAAAKAHCSTKSLKTAWKRNKLERIAKRQISRHRREQKLEKLRLLADEFRQYAVELGKIPSATWLMRTHSAFYGRVEHAGGFKRLRRKFPDLKRKPWSETPKEWFPPEESASA